jgi:Holliday junction DNA helicase RuvA
MIGKLKGLIDSYDDDTVILDVNGVGYVVHCSGRTLTALPQVGEATSLIIETHVREDMIRLYGFRSVTERDWFKLLQSVQGVGSKVALAILSVLDLGELATAIGTLDKAMIARAPGVGPKLAARIVSELKDRAPAFGGVDPLTSRLAGAVEDKTALPAPVSDAISALVNLGYAQAQAAAAIASVIKREGADIPAAQLIRLGLKEMAK